jgi:hypothetical protein
MSVVGGIGNTKLVGFAESYTRRRVGDPGASSVSFAPPCGLTLRGDLSALTCSVWLQSVNADVLLR